MVLPDRRQHHGAAMRVSPCGYAAKTLEEAVSLAKSVTKVTHNHPEGMKAAKAVSSAIFLARSGKKMEEIRDHIEKNYYKIDFTLDQIRPTYEFDVTCQGSVPQAFEAFYESTGFEDAVRNAISIGGDSDTIAAITGGMAGAYYGIPSNIYKNALAFLDNSMVGIVAEFYNRQTTERGIQYMKTPMRKVCANCREEYIAGDKYCRYCGAPMGKPAYIEEDFACIYGPPPIRRVHTCEKCGYSWETCRMIDNQRRCPKCGGPAPARGDDECL